MAMITSAYANKILKKLNDDKEYLRKMESEGCMYVAALDEEPVIPDYNYEQVAAAIEEIDNQIVKIKHAINLANLNSEIQVGDKTMTVDQILIRMAQLNRRRATLDTMRKQETKKRLTTSSYMARKTAPEYCYINYDLDVVKADYERIDAEIAAMQIALDKYNQTFEFEVEVEI
ncbi:MAG: hypothetical protein IJ336_09880 [Lachnospiraceae bacterium]|nr:hypothetical protein [Lachnospiraceae bacterium]MBQ7833864.1 hypothetical protein [Lachnospiraceae bacterium]